MVGDSKGTLQAWTTSKPRNAPTSDGIVLVPAHRFSLGDAAITALAVSSRSDGCRRLGRWQSPLGLRDERSNHGRSAARGRSDRSRGDRARNNGLVAVNRKGVSWWKLDPAYPEISFATLFRPVWYEGYPGPTHSWQSSSGSDSFEPKFGLWPLVFGTLKATFYSMLFGAPLALLAALYTSEFLHPRFRPRLSQPLRSWLACRAWCWGFSPGWSSRRRPSRSSPRSSLRCLPCRSCCFWPRTFGNCCRSSWPCAGAMATAGHSAGRSAGSRRQDSSQGRLGSEFCSAAISRPGSSTTGLAPARPDGL